MDGRGAGRSGASSSRLHQLAPQQLFDKQSAFVVHAFEQAVRQYVKDSLAYRLSLLRLQQARADAKRVDDQYRLAPGMPLVPPSTLTRQEDLARWCLARAAARGAAEALAAQLAQDCQAYIARQQETLVLVEQISSHIKDRMELQWVADAHDAPASSSAGARTGPAAFLARVEAASERMAAAADALSEAIETQLMQDSAFEEEKRAARAQRRFGRSTADEVAGPSSETGGGSSSGQPIDAATFGMRLKRLYENWQGKRGPWSGANAIAIALGTRSGSSGGGGAALRYSDAAVAHQWLFGRELPETLVVLTASEMHVVANQQQGTTPTSLR